MSCIKMRDARTHNPKAICPLNFVEVRGLRCKGVLFNVGSQRKSESFFPVEPTAGVFSTPPPSLG